MLNKYLYLLLFMLNNYCINIVIFLKFNAMLLYYYSIVIV